MLSFDCPPQEGRRRSVSSPPDPLYRVEGDPERRADGIYDQMQPVGADEIVIETPEHNRKLEDLTDDQILLVTQAWGQRVEDLKRDRRFKYVSIYKKLRPPSSGKPGRARTRIRKLPRPRSCPEEFSTNCAPRGSGTGIKNAVFFATS